MKVTGNQHYAYDIASGFYSLACDELGQDPDRYGALTNVARVIGEDATNLGKVLSGNRKISLKKICEWIRLWEQNKPKGCNDILLTLDAHGWALEGFVRFVDAKQWMLFDATGLPTEPKRIEFDIADTAPTGHLFFALVEDPYGPWWFEDRRWVIAAVDPWKRADSWFVTPDMVRDFGELYQPVQAACGAIPFAPGRRQ